MKIKKKRMKNKILAFFILIFLIPSVFAVKMVFSNAQSAVGATKGNLDYFLKFYRYIFPHSLEPLNILAQDFNEKQADILLLVEIDGRSFRSPENQVDYLNKFIGYNYSRFVHTTYLQGYANQGYGIISRYPIIPDEKYKLASYYDKRFLQYFKIESPEVNISVFLVHLGIFKSERDKQIEQISEILKNYDEPYLIAGDFNFKNKEIEIFKSKTGLVDVFSGEKTYPTWKPTEEMDKVFITSGINVSDWEVMQNTRFSDHLPIYLEFNVSNNETRA